MPQKIVLSVGEIRVIGELRDTATAEAIVKALPLSAETQRWGGEIYFPVPVTLPLESDCRETLMPGELGYWPEGNMFCIFFGATPASQGKEIRPASAVNVFGRLVGRWSPIKQVPAGKTIRVELFADGAAVESSEPLSPDPEEKPEPDSLYSPTSPGETKTEPPAETPPQPVQQEEPKTYSPSPMPESALFEHHVEEIESQPMAVPLVEETPASDEGFETNPINEGMTPTAPKAKTSLFKNILSDKKKLLGLIEGIAILVLIALLGIQIGRSGSSTIRKDLDQLRKDTDSQKQTLETLDKNMSRLQAEFKTFSQGVPALVTQVVDPKLKVQMGAVSQQIAALQKQLVSGEGGLGVWVKNPANNHSYCVSPVPLPWHQARDAAQKMGGYLATLTDAKENEWVVATFGEQTEFWIGLDDELEERKWVWTSGEKFEYANWAAGEPDNYRKNQHYVVINSIVPDKGNLEPGRWKDVSCNEIHLAIIERNQ